MTTTQMAFTVETLRAAHAAATPTPEMFGPTAQFQARKAAAATPEVRRPTARQRELLTDLFAERAGIAEAEAIKVEVNAIMAAGGMTFEVAKATITDLIAIKRPRAAAPATTAPAPRGGAWANIPDGRYAVESATGNNDLDFFLVTTAGEDEGDWAGMRRVERVIGGNADAPVKGQARRAALEAIAAATYTAAAREVTLEDGTTGIIPARDASGPEGAALHYADEIGRCIRCNRHLTDLTSRINGLGPVCILKGE